MMIGAKVGRINQSLAPRSALELVLAIGIDPRRPRDDSSRFQVRRRRSVDGKNRERTCFAVIPFAVEFNPIERSACIDA